MPRLPDRGDMDGRGSMVHESACGIRLRKSAPIPSRVKITGGRWYPSTML